MVDVHTYIHTYTLSISVSVRIYELHPSIYRRSLVHKEQANMRGMRRGRNGSVTPPCNHHHYPSQQRTKTRPQPINKAGPVRHRVMSFL